MKPFLLLDIDGCLCPYGDGEGLERIFLGDLWIWMDPSNMDRLARLAQSFALIWATAWEHEANDELGPLYGLGPLPVIEFGAKRLEGRILVPRTTDGYDTWKLPWILSWVGQHPNRPIAWIDDDLGDDAFAWADDRETPTILVRTTPSIGLTDKDVEQLEKFAKGVANNGTYQEDGRRVRAKLPQVRKRISARRAKGST